MFTRLASDWREWLGFARALKIAAEVTAKRFDDISDHAFAARSPDALIEAGPVGAVALMLAGLSIENLAKARIIQLEGLGPNPRRLPDLNKHGLRSYLKRANVSLSTEEAELVDRLEEQVRWSGRYPVPTKAEQDPGSRLWMMDDMRLFSQLYDRLEQALKSRS